MQDTRCGGQVVDEEATAKKRQEAEEAARSKGEDADKVEVDPVKKRESRTEWDWTVQNDNKPIWTRSPKEVPRRPVLTATRSRARSVCLKQSENQLFPASQAVSQTPGCPGAWAGTADVLGHLQQFRFRQIKLFSLDAAASHASCARRLQVTQEEYNSFFKSSFKEFLDPAIHTHFSVEGTLEFSALLYVPGMAPFEETVRPPLHTDGVRHLLVVPPLST